MSRNVQYIDKQDEFTTRIIRSAYPSYKGKRVKIVTGDTPTNLRSYWDGGSRDSYVFVALGNMERIQVESNHPYFEKDRPSELKELPLGVVLVKHCIFCGKDMGITIYANGDDISKSLPLQEEVSDDEKIVLEYTASLKNTYGGETNIRFKRAHKKEGISQETWELTKAGLIEKKMLRKNGSITPLGMNHRINKW